MFRTLISLGALSGVLFVVQAQEQKAEKGIMGHFQIAHGEKGGKDIPFKEYEGSIVHFDGSKVTGTDKSRKTFFSAKYTIDKSSTPWKIHMVAENPKPGTKADGVISITQDMIVNLAYNLPGGEAPTSFKTKENQQVFTLRRMSEVDAAKFRDQK